ncbi:hypothetical protein T492DRAFT_1121243 [Pavlovales sp. CCMP2436]|nr:hypothetical protein T492DRAFT_1121243 [Pavlovales sp. CCMP2436]
MPASKTIQELRAAGVEDTVNAMRRAIHSPSDGWHKTFKEFRVSAGKPGDEISAEVGEIYKDFDELIDWACAFRYQLPITDKGRLYSFIECLARSGYELDLDLLEQTDFFFFYSCNCEHFVHYGLCKYSVARAKFEQLITAWPAELNPTLRRGGQSNRRGRMPKSRRGNPLGTV